MASREKKEKLTLWKVSWYDHCSSRASWSSRDSLKSVEPLVIDTVGWQVGENKKTITLASSVNIEDDNYGGDMTIVKSCILRKKRLSE